MGLNLSLLLPAKIAQVLTELYPSEPKWSTDDIPDLTGKVIFVTGANGGIGSECTRVLASHGATVYATARSAAKGVPLVEKINAELGSTLGDKAGRVVFLQLDLNTLSSIKAAVDEFNNNETRLDVLLHNAGIMTPPEDKHTKGSNAIDMQWSTNVLGPFVLTRLLLPLLINTARNTGDGSTRVVNVSSVAQFAAPSNGINFRDLNAGGSLRRYGQSKLGTLVFSVELARRYGQSGIVSVSVNPGNIETPLWKHQESKWFALNSIAKKYPVALGALTQLYAATSPEVTMDDNGLYFKPWARRGPQPLLSNHSNNPVLGAELWEWCETRMKEAGIVA